MSIPKQWRIKSKQTGIIDSSGNRAIIYGFNSQPQFADDNSALQITAIYKYQKETQIQIGTDPDDGTPIFETQISWELVQPQGAIMKQLEFDQVNYLYAQIEPYLQSKNYMDRRQEAQYLLQLEMVKADGRLWDIDAGEWEMEEVI